VRQFARQVRHGRRAALRPAACVSEGVQRGDPGSCRLCKLRRWPAHVT
jgi:hypothetical protein